MSTTTGDPIDCAIERLLDQGDNKVLDAVGALLEDFDARQCRQIIDLLGKYCPELKPVDDYQSKRTWNEEVITTLPGAGIRMLKIEDNRIVTRRPVIGFIVTKGNFIRPVTTMAVLPDLYDRDDSSSYWVMLHPSGEVEVDGGDGVEEARLYASLTEFEKKLMMNREPMPLYARYEEVMMDIGARRRDQQRAEFEERVRQHTAYTETLELKNEERILED